MAFRPKHVLVPVAVAAGDDITLAEHLVDDACDLVRATPAARLSLVYVDNAKSVALGADTGFAPMSYWQALAEYQEANRATARDALAQLEKRVAAAGIAVDSEILEPFAGTGEAIAQAAARRDVDCIVLLSHSRRGLKRLLLGSVAERVAHVATVPVLILCAAPSAAAPAAAATPSPRSKR